MIRVLSTPACPYCVALKGFLKEHNVEFEDIDVSVNLEAQKEMIEKTKSMSVPVLNIGDDWIVGFDKEKISKLLGL